MPVWIIFAALFILLFLGVPVAYSIGLSSVLFLLITQLKPIIIIAQRTAIGMDSFVLLAIPLFTLAGYLMEFGGLSKRLISWVEKLFNWMPGSMGTITIVSCAIFAALTGSGPATVAAIGSIMVPSMLKQGYSKEDSSGLLAVAGALGPIIPPSIVMIVYATTMGISVPSMFIGGIIPGILIAIALIIVNTLLALKNGIKPKRTKYTLKEFMISTKKSIGALMMPVIILGGIYGGIFTPTEAASVCTLYALILGLLYKELNFENIKVALNKTVQTSAMVMFIVGVSNGFGWILATTKVPTILANAILPYIHNKVSYLLILMSILFVVGCIMETLASVVILAPILVPIGVELGIDPLHLGLVFVISLVVGFVTPPFGVNLFTATGICNVSFNQVVKGSLPYLIATVIIVVIIAFIPEITTFLPGLV
jgi:C4-dicarboxylate transporter DctM subunit